MEKILQVKDLELSFNTYKGDIHAIRGISFDLFKGETLAIVGESGSGKSVTIRTIMRLLSNNAEIRNGSITFEGEDLLKKSQKEMQTVRGNEIATVFQDPMTSLNPLMRIGDQIMEPILLHQKVSKKEAKKQALELLDLVGIPNPEARFKQYPFQFSGGQRQRIVIAIALASKPKILIADEPTTALDVTIQAQILELLRNLQEQLDMSIIFITHDLGVVANVADRVAVMYAGEIVEIGEVNEIFYHPQHPYTWGLLNSMPTLGSMNRLSAIPGTPPDLSDPPKGDAFAVRSDYAMDIDFVEKPPFFQVSDTHYAKTWLLHPDAPDFERPLDIQKRYQKFSLIKGG